MAEGRRHGLPPQIPVKSATHHPAADDPAAMFGGGVPALFKEPGFAHVLERGRLRLLHVDQLVSIALERDARIKELETEIAKKDEALSSVTRERDRLQVELLALRRLRQEVPRTVGDLLAWRQARNLTQEAAAKLLGVGRATVERAEGQDFDTLLGPALRKAFEEQAHHLVNAEEQARAQTGALGAGAGKKRRRG